MIYITRYFFWLFCTFMFFSCLSNNANRKSTESVDTIAESSTERSARKNILFFGNSLTAGYGLDGQDQAFPALIQTKIDSMGLPYLCINAGLSGETSAGGRERIDWLLTQHIDIFVLELGANDGLRGLSTSSTYDNLSAIVEKVKEAYPECTLVLAGMKVPPSMGQAYFADFENIFPRLAKEYDMHLIPFLLEDVAGLKELNQGDGVHPTADGQHILAKNVWSTLKPLL